MVDEDIMTDKNPYAYGYARMPRIIRKGYSDLTKLQKLLYIYLRDLCGETGTCYRTLRSLSKETDFSTGYLSENIPVLHNQGLIHAEKRKHSENGWEVWHISIVDIWEKNAAFLKTEQEKRSQHEQITEDEDNKTVHSMNKIDKTVHAVNESVHRVNESSQNCSRGAHIIRTIETKKPVIENQCEKEKETPPHHSSSEYLPTAEEQAIIAKWEEITGFPLSTNSQSVRKRLADLMRVLATGKATLEDIKRVKDYLEKQSYWQDKEVTFQVVSSQFTDILPKLNKPASQGITGYKDLAAANKQLRALNETPEEKEAREQDEANTRNRQRYERLRAKEELDEETIQARTERFVEMYQQQRQEKALF